MLNIAVDTIKTGQNLKKIRKSKGLPIYTVAKELGLQSKQAVYKWERGDCLPRVDHFTDLCSYIKLRLKIFCDFMSRRKEEDMKAVRNE